MSDELLYHEALHLSQEEIEARQGKAKEVSIQLPFGEGSYFIDFSEGSMKAYIITENQARAIRASFKP